MTTKKKAYKEVRTSLSEKLNNIKVPLPILQELKPNLKSVLEQLCVINEGQVTNKEETVRIIDASADEFNEFLFDFTSKIPVEEIEKAKNKSVQVKEVVSPYTVVKSNNKGLKTVLLTVFIIVVLAVVGYFIASYVYGNDFQDNNITYQIRR